MISSPRYHHGENSPTDDSLDLDHVAAEIGVHYQTVYRWVRAEKFPAEIVDGRYRVQRRDVEALLRARRAPSRPKPPSAARLARAADKMHTLLITGDELAARDLAQTIVTEHAPVADLIQQVLAPPLRRIGQDWSDGNLSIWVEHRASAITERILSDVAPSPAGPRRGTVMVAAVSGDRHSLATTMAAVTLRDNDWFVHHLGADMPPDELVSFCAEHDIDIAVITLVNPDCTEVAETARARIAAAGKPAVIGGPGRSLDDLLEQVDEVVSNAHS